LDRALNSSVRKLPADFACTTASLAPVVVVLTYRATVRHVVIDMSGCPSIVMTSGSQHYLIGQAAGKVLRFYDKTARRLPRPKP
jgi:hypothetical protein